MDIDLPSSTNGALLVIAVVGLGLSVYHGESGLALFFGGLIAVTGAIWLLHVSMSILRNVNSMQDSYGSDVFDSWMKMFVYLILLLAMALVAGAIATDIAIS